MDNRICLTLYRKLYKLLKLISSTFHKTRFKNRKEVRKSTRHSWSACLVPVLCLNFWLKIFKWDIMKLFLVRFEFLQHQSEWQDDENIHLLCHMTGLNVVQRHLNHWKKQFYCKSLKIMLFYLIPDSILMMYYRCWKDMTAPKWQEHHLNTL